MSFSHIASRFSLAAKINALNITIVLIASVGICAFMIHSELTAYYQELLDRGLSIAGAAAQDCAPGVLANDGRSLDPVKRALSSEPGVAYVAVYQRGGRVLLSDVFLPSLSVPEGPNSSFDSVTQVRHSDLVARGDGERYLDILYPIRARQTGVAASFLKDASVDRVAPVIGYLRLGLSQRALRDKLRHLIVPAVLFTLALVAMGSLLSVTLSRRITSPIKQLQLAAEEISGGNFESAVAITTRDEIADLARAFNFMREGLRKYRDQLMHDAFHDVLTGLPNRALFLDRLTHAMLIANRRHGYQFGVLFLDLDGFKMINDSLGHELGDELLAGICERLRASTRPGDTIARLGSDEFGILLEDISGDGNAVFVTGRIQEALAMPFPLSGNEVFATCSIGIALSSRGTETAEQMLRDAETAMHQAKAKGRAHSLIFERGMHEHAVNRLQVEMDLRRAVERHEFVPYYQPIVSLDDRRVIGFEALVRWNHPVRGIVLPAEFIRIAEETGLIVAIDRQVLRRACEQMKHWADEGKGQHLSFVSVNLSHRHLLQADVVEHIERVINETGLDPSRLKLEITENVIFDRPDAAVALLSRLRQLGLQLYVDDFGTGYSSLSYLHRLPINGLKIDRSFISRIGAPGENHAVIRTIMTLAQDLQIEAIAEGIETEQQCAHIELLQCRYAQGNLFSRPLASADVPAAIS
jgi:diguanylate cyclase (GGDEF)-like protein